MTTQIDRRHLMKGVAWSVPVITVAAAAPARAASTTPVSIAISEVCKVDPHNHGEGKPLQIDLALTGGPSTVLLESVSVAGVVTQVGQSVDAPGMFRIRTDKIPNGSLQGPNTQILLTFEVDGGPEQTVTLAHGAIPDCHSKKS